MKNVIGNIIHDVYRKIPNEILKEAFFEELKTTRTLDSIIQEKIITGVVLPNCNLYAGKMAKIILRESYQKNLVDDVAILNIGNGYGVYAIPPEQRENRPIVAILDVSYPTTLALYGSFPNIGVSGRSVTNGFDQMLGSFTHEPAWIAPTAIIIDGDSGIIQLSPPASLHVDWMLSCMLAFDNEFSNIGLNMVNPLKTLTEHATKSYIYNKLIIRMNQGYLMGGLQLESIRSIIESYADAEEKFNEALLKFRGSAMFSPENAAALFSIMIGG